jgi:hypothetical protein
LVISYQEDRGGQEAAGWTGAPGLATMVERR